MMLSKYDWGAACRFFPGFRETPGVVRLAWQLCEFFNDDVGCAYPTRETLAETLGSAPESVSKWLKMLADGGAITCLAKGALPAEKQMLIGRNSRRAQVYILNFGWALDVLKYRDEMASQRVAQKVISQPPSAAEGNQPDTPKGNQSVIPEGGYPVTLIPYENTLAETLEEGALEHRKVSASAREDASNEYARAKGWAECAA